MIRKNYLTGEYVFFSPSRGGRPLNFKENAASDISMGKCPFCPENEYMTPKRIYLSDDGKIRIVSNKYPFVEQREEYFSEHDVVIDTPLHNQKIESFSNEHLKSLMTALKKRQTELENNERTEYVQIFKNSGAFAGASQPHSHWQIAALPVVPERIKKMAEAFEKYKKENNKYYFEQCDEKYIIEKTEYFNIFCPYDSRFSYEINIAPKRHIKSVKYMDEYELENLGIALKNAVKRLLNVCRGVSFNICLYSEPAKGNEDFCFYVQIIPRIGNMAGFEFSTGCYINSVYPETAANMFREAVD